MLTHVDLFSGIGGFALAAQWAGIETVAFCEKDNFCQKVLDKHWPGVPIHDDIKTFDGTKYSNIFLLTGGFPCQPFSFAGKRRGKEDDRYLWPEMLRVISEIKPRWIIGENVAGFIGMGLDDCISDLERECYEVQPFIIPACAVNADHLRKRVWIVANSYGIRLPRWEKEPRLERPKQQLERLLPPDSWVDTSAYRINGNKNGVSDRVDRTKSIGNAVVPQIPYYIMIAIIEVESLGGY